jgi:hypothetical protein
MDLVWLLSSDLYAPLVQGMSAAGVSPAMLVGVSMYTRELLRPHARGRWITLAVYNAIACKNPAILDYLFGRTPPRGPVGLLLDSCGDYWPEGIDWILSVDSSVALASLGQVELLSRVYDNSRRDDVVLAAAEYDQSHVILWMHAAELVSEYDFIVLQAQFVARSKRSRHYHDLLSLGNDNSRTFIRAVHDYPAETAEWFAQMLPEFVIYDESHTDLLAKFLRKDSDLYECYPFFDQDVENMVEFSFHSLYENNYEMYRLSMCYLLDMIRR